MQIHIKLLLNIYAKKLKAKYKQNTQHTQTVERKTIKFFQNKNKYISES